jgi:hypothetical protein
MPSSSSAKQAKQTSYDAAQAVPFSRIHGRPTRHHYKELKKEAANLASKVDDITFDWSCDTVTGDEYGLLAEILDEGEYNHLTNLVWTLEIKPAS